MPLSINSNKPNHAIKVESTKNPKQFILMQAVPGSLVKGEAWVIVKKTLQWSEWLVYGPRRLTQLLLGSKGQINWLLKNFRQPLWQLKSRGQSSTIWLLLQKLTATAPCHNPNSISFISSSVLCWPPVFQEHTTGEIQEHRQQADIQFMHVSTQVKLKNLQSRIFSSVINFFLLASCSFAIHASQPKDIDCLSQPAV